MVMAPSTLRSFVFLAWISVVGIGLLGLWLWDFAPGENPLPLIIGSRPRVTVRQGVIVGSEVKTGYPQTLEMFLGIPYGLSTAGERRFRPPVGVNASTEIFDASKYGDRCPAGPSRDGFPQSEDCLNLNIYRPKARDESKKLPVLVHVHGGAFNTGFGSNRQISNLVAWSAEPFIGISFNYRIGALGFLPSRLTAEEGLLNLGLKDQALLFEWVQENIAAFGGNPDDVTLMGVSAGAHSIGHHLMHNTDRPPPFHKVIIESGATTARAVYTPTNPMHEQQFQEFLTELGFQDVPEPYIMDELRTLDVKKIKEASDTIFDIYNPSIRWPFQPVIDGEGGMIPIPPIDAWRSGKWHKVPILTGFNTNEGAMFVPKTISTASQFTAFLHRLLPSLSKDDLEILNDVYPDPLSHPDSKYVETRKGVGLGAQFKRLEQAYGHFAYVAPVRQTARFAAADGDAPVYLYHFAVNSSVIGGADHGNHAPFVTYNRDIRERSDSIEEISGLMHAYWTSFITTGDPNAIEGRYPDRLPWPAYTRDAGKLIVFGAGNDEYAGGQNKGTAVQIMDDTWALEECRFWWARTELFEL